MRQIDDWEPAGGASAAGSEPCGAIGDLLGDDGRITLIGLIFETAVGLRRALTPALDREIGVSGQSFEILIRLARTPGGSLRMSDLAEQSGFSPSGLTRAVDRLVAAELIQRDLCPGDRRGAFASLTELGSRRIKDALVHHIEDIGRLLEGTLSQGEEEELKHLLSKLRDRLHPNAALVSDPPGRRAQ